MQIDRETAHRLTSGGWKPTMEPTQLMKIYDGYIGMIQLVPPDWQDRKVHARWSIWHTGDHPIRHGHRVNLIRAAGRVDREIELLLRPRNQRTVPRTSGGLIYITPQ